MRRFRYKPRSDRRNGRWCISSSSYSAQREGSYRNDKLEDTQPSSTHHNQWPDSRKPLRKIQHADYGYAGLFGSDKIKEKKGWSIRIPGCPLLVPFFISPAAIIFGLKAHIWTPAHCSRSRIISPFPIS
jgi:hypothetical protein